MFSPLSVVFHRTQTSLPPSLTFAQPPSLARVSALFLLFFSSLSSFIFLKILKSWGHQENFFFFLQPFLALSFLLHSVFFLSSSTSAVFILIFPQLSFHILILDFFPLYCEFLWCLFSAIFSSFLSCCWRFTYKVISDFPSVSAAVVHCL